MKKSILLVCSVIALSALTACGSSSSGGGTTTTDATDAAFPDSVGVDVSEVASTDLHGVNFSLSKSGGIPDTGSMTAPITTATNMADIVTKLADHIFSGIATALNTELKSTDTQVSGTAFGGTVTINFADYGYDVDGDGTNDPCSGTASIKSTPQYACFRAWFTDASDVTSRLMIGYLQTAPTSTTAGKGKAIADPTLVADIAEVPGMGTVMTYLAWDNTATTANSFDGYMSGAVATGMDLTVGRIVAESTADNKITLRTAAFFATPKTIPVPSGDVSADQVLFNSQFFLTGTNLLFEDHFYLAGVSVGDIQNDIPFCGVIATGDPASGNPANITKCTDEGISLTGIEYPTLAAADASKTAFPGVAVFPLTPPLL